MHVACCQLDIAWEDKAANYARVQAMIAEAALPAGTLLLLPEMFATGFSMNAEAIAEGVDGPSAASCPTWRPAIESTFSAVSLSVPTAAENLATKRCSSIRLA